MSKPKCQINDKWPFNFKFQTFNQYTTEA